MVTPWWVCLFLSLSCLGEHIFIMSQLLLMHKSCDIGKCDKKSRINTNVSNNRDWKLHIYCMNQHQECEELRLETTYILNGKKVKITMSPRQRRMKVTNKRPLGQHWDDPNPNV